MPEYFRCDVCQGEVPVDLLCVPSARATSLLCVLCCRCLAHTSDDPGGVAVFAGTPLTWRGLHTSESRTRRHS